MNIDATSMAASMVFPLLLAVILIWTVRRGQPILPLVLTFMVGGFTSFVFALLAGRALVPIEEFISGTPGSVRSNLASAFLTAAIPEELGRILFAGLILLLIRSLAHKGIVLMTAMIGLGFAMFENMFYSLTAGGGLFVLLERIVPASSHAASAIIMGSLLQSAISKGRPFSRRLLLLAFLIPCLLHGLYDFGAFMIESSEFPELPEEPTLADLKPVAWVLAPLVLVTLIGLIEIIWAGIVLYRLKCEK